MCKHCRDSKRWAVALKDSQEQTCGWTRYHEAGPEREVAKECLQLLKIIEK